MALNFGVAWNPFGGDISINISTDSVEVAKYVCKIAGSLGALYLGYQAVRPLIETAVRNGLGGERDDQDVGGIRPGSLHVLLRCLTDERFLEVLADFESGRLKESLQKEFSRVGIKVVGLKVKIENMVEVEETRKAINKRSLQMNKDLFEDVKKIEIDDPECDLEMNVPGSSSGVKSSKKHINWITVGELINVIKKPVALYTTHIVERWHVILCKDCQPFGHCRNPGTCQMKKKPEDLCPSCNGWYKELAKSHRNKDKRKIEWRKNCDTSRFAVDPWEVAKFFMPVLGDNKSTVIDAASTDLSYLLNVLTWMKDVAFTPDRRVDLELVKNLRSDVRNLWAYEPNQELTDANFKNALDVANKFIADLASVFSRSEVKKCIEDIKFTQTNKMSNVRTDYEMNATGSTSSGMNSPEEHINWITIGEVINVIKKPIVLYANHILERWHITLSKNCQSFGRCRNPETCQMKMKPGDLCPSCNGWYQELAKSHRNKDKRKIEWRKNCDTSKFSVDPWEVAKFFMPVLGDNKSTVIDAASTDLSYLLNVLTWMEDVAFAPDRRVDLNLVKDLRTVRNLWAHAPNQELTGDDFNNAFDIANKFVADLDNVFSCDEVKKCIEDIKFAQTNKVSNVATEAELRALNSQRDLLRADVSQLKEEMKDEIEEMKGEKKDKSFDSQVIEEREKELERLVNTEQKCSTKINLFCQVKSL